MPTDVVIRGCAEEEADKVRLSMEEHYISPDAYVPGEWGLSVACLPGGSPDEILRNAPQIRQRYYRVAPLAPLIEGGFTAKHDHDLHGLIISDTPPGNDEAERIVGAFGPPIENPYYEERKRHRGN